MRANTYIREVETVFKTNGGTPEKIKVSRSKDAYQLFCDLENATQEKLIALHLAGDNTVLCFQVVHIGSINEAHCNPADILRTTLLTGATSLVVLHNHPSGSITPSEQDKKSLERLKRACVLFDVVLFDWMIIGAGKYYSAADAGEI